MNKNYISASDFISISKAEFIAYFLPEMFSGINNIQADKNGLEFKGNSYSIPEKQVVLQMYTAHYSDWGQLLSNCYNVLIDYYGSSNNNNLWHYEVTPHDIQKITL